jgi:DNA processing protein
MHFVAAPPVVELAPTEVLGDLNEIERKNAPAALYLAGNPDLLTAGRRVSVVGSREASDEGLARARSLSRTLVKRGFIVVSGLAAGIDTAAHLAALEAGGRTIAVLGTPLDDFYPRENEALQRRLMREQLVVSQFPSGYPSAPRNFPMRNRTMALLSDATVIVEAGDKSGTLHQGWEALRLGRPLFLMESVARDPSLRWPAEMIRYGAQMLSRENLEHCLDEIPALTVGGDVAAEA